MPWAYKFEAFVRHYRKTRRLLRELIFRSKYLVFGIGYLWGDWAALACLEALRQKRPYAVWTDLVDYQVVRWEAEGKPWMRGLYRKYILSTSVKYYHHYLIRKCKLGLFHGMDCYRAYAPFCANPQVVHDIHVKPRNAIAPDAWSTRLVRSDRGVHFESGTWAVQMPERVESTGSRRSRPS